MVQHTTNTTELCIGNISVYYTCEGGVKCYIQLSKIFRFPSNFNVSNKSIFKANNYKLLKGKAVVTNNVLILYLNIIPDLKTEIKK